MATLDWDKLQRNQLEYNKRREFAINQQKKAQSAKRERMESKNDLDDIIDRQIRRIQEERR